MKFHMENLMKNFGDKRYLRRSAPAEAPIHQRSAFAGGEEAPEDEEFKTEIWDTLDELGNWFSAPENYALIDEIVKEEGIGQELAARFSRYGETLRDKNVSDDSSAEDIFINLKAYLPWIDRIKKARAKGEKENPVSQNKVIECVQSFNNYLDLLERHDEFEKAELGNPDGFLVRFFDQHDEKQRQELLRLRSSKRAYIEKCAEILEQHARKEAA